MNQLSKRVLSSLIVTPCFVLAVHAHAFSYFLCFMVIMLVALQEYYNLLTLCGGNPHKALGTFVGLLSYVLVFLYTGGWLSECFLYLIVPALCGIFLQALWQSQTPLASLTSIAYTLLGVVHVSIPFALLHVLAFDQKQYNYQIVLGIMLLLWANDVGAYFVGSSLGKHKLAPHISPNKTWEGSLGGVLFVIATSYLIAHHYHVFSSPVWLGIGVTVAIAGTLGDLAESMLKRSAGVKDASKLIPGHGGMLDRFDSFLLAIPAVLAFVRLVY